MITAQTWHLSKPFKEEITALGRLGGRLYVDAAISAPNGPPGLAATG
jgi:hypothetical protein